jgi:hypothetical protein
MLDQGMRIYHAAQVLKTCCSEITLHLWCLQSIYNQQCCTIHFDYLEWFGVILKARAGNPYLYQLFGSGCTDTYQAKTNT